MAQPIYANLVAGTIAANIGPADTAILLGAGQGATFPAITGGNWYYATLVHNTLGIVEIVRVTAKSADTLTVVRGQDGTGAASFTTGTLVELRLVAQTLRELDYRAAMGVANGLATLDAGVKIPDAQLSANVPLLTAGKLNISTIPDAVATDAELAGKANLAGGAAFTGNMSIQGNLTVDPAGAGAAVLAVGNDAFFRDINVANALSLQGVGNNAIGYLYFGNGGHYVGWNGAVMVSDGQMIWTAGNFDPNTKAAQTNPYIAGQVRCTGQMYADSGRFQSGGTDVVIGGNGGGVYLRPHSVDNGTNQGIINASGLAQFVDVQSYSDKRRKKKIRRVYADIDIARKLQLQTWVNKADNSPGWGLVAQDLLAKGLDRHVGGGGDVDYSVDYAKVALEVAMANDLRLRRVEAALNL